MSSPEGPAFFLRAALDWIDALPKDLSIEQTMPGFDRDAAEQAMNAAMHPRPLAEYHEDYGPVTWFTWNGEEWLGEPSYIGRPDDSDWPGYHTHWTPHPEFPRSAPR